LLGIYPSLAPPSTTPTARASKFAPRASAAVAVSGHSSSVLGRVGAG
jgi:hypothetical protein